MYRPFESGIYRTFCIIHPVRLSDVKAPAAGGGNLRTPLASAAPLVAVHPLEAAYVSLNGQGLITTPVSENLRVQAPGRYQVTREGLPLDRRQLMRMPLKVNCAPKGHCRACRGLPPVELVAVYLPASVAGQNE